MSEAKGRKEEERKDKRNPSLTNPRYTTTSRRKSSTTEDYPASVRKKEQPITSVGNSPQQTDPYTVNALGRGIYQTASVSRAYVSKDYQERFLVKNAVLLENGISRPQLDHVPYNIGASRSKSGELKAETFTESKSFRDRTYEKSKWNPLLCVQCSAVYNTSDRLPRSLGCGHTICEACLQVLILRAPRCPVCQTNFNMKNIQDFFIDSLALARISLLNITSPESMLKTNANKTEVEVNLFDTRRSTEVNNRKKEKQTNSSVMMPQMSRRSRSSDNMIIVPETEEKLKGEMTGVKSKMHHSAMKPLETKDINSSILMKENIRRNSLSNDFCHKKIKRTAMVCRECSIFYDHSARLPRILSCGHSICTSCLRFLIKHAPSCPTCQESFKSLKHVTDAVVNKTLCELINVEDALYDIVSENKFSEDKLYPVVSGAEKPVVTASSAERHERDPLYSMSNHVDDSLIIPKTSPHKSNCLEVGVSPTSHCASCQKWVCDECGIIDHPQQNGCYLIPKKEALLQMKEAYVNDVRVTGESVEGALKALHIYQEHLEAFSTTMQAAFECIGKEKERIKVITRRGQEKKREMEAAVSGFSSAQNLPEALALLQQVQDLSIGTQQWTTADAAETLDCKRIIETVKEILLSSVYMMKMSDTKKNAVLLLVASQKVLDVTLLSRMTVQGKHLFVHCLEKLDTVPKGTRAIPFLSIKACLNSSSPLVFLDIGWNGKVAGRLIIRLLGETFGGRQFLMLCTGEGGPSFCNTHFHRVSLRGFPGEHIWGGDYDNGDGSGGKSFLGVSEKEKLALPAGKSMPITAGLVAGNYVETTPGSLFCIYTKDQIQPNRDPKLYDGESVELNNHSSFGIVEHGLDVLDSALKQKSITDVIIYSCGIIIDA